MGVGEKTKITFLSENNGIVRIVRQGNKKWPKSNKDTKRKQQQQTTPPPSYPPKNSPPPDPDQPNAAYPLYTLKN